MRYIVYFNCVETRMVEVDAPSLDQALDQVDLDVVKPLHGEMWGYRQPHGELQLLDKALMEEM